MTCFRDGGLPGDCSRDLARRDSDLRAGGGLDRQTRLIDNGWMDPTTLILAVAAILGMTSCLRLPGWEQRRTLLVNQFLNLLVIIALLAGIPGFHGATKVVNWVLGPADLHDHQQWALTAALQQRAHESADIEAVVQIKSASAEAEE